MLKKPHFFILLFVGLCSMNFSCPDEKVVIKKKALSVAASDTLSWKLLSMVKYTKKPSKDYGEIMFPQVNAKLKSLHKKKVFLSGFIVPIDNDNYAISKNVFASCFFCGKAGPETIAGLHFRKLKGRLKTDLYVTVEGIFRVNENNPDDWMYNLDDVVIVKGD